MTPPPLKSKKAIAVSFEEIGKGQFLAYVSEIAFAEIHCAGEEKRNELIKVVRQINPEELPMTEEAVVLATHYIEPKIIPANHRNDALHIAIATVHNLDVIVSWNFEHMVKLKTRREVPAINALMRYKSIEICSPLEMIEP